IAVDADLGFAVAVPVADNQAILDQAEDKDRVDTGVEAMIVVRIEREHGGAGRAKRGGIAEDADLGAVGAAVPVADDDAVGDNAELETQIARLQLAVVVGVLDEQSGAEPVATVAKDAELGDAVAGPVANDGLVACLTEIEGFAGVEFAIAI